MFVLKGFLLAICQPGARRHSVAPNGRVRRKKGPANCSYATVRSSRWTAQAASTGCSAEELHPEAQCVLSGNPHGGPMTVAGDTDVDSPVHHGGEESTKAWAPGATSGPAGRRRGVLGGA
jgi:hypothetical protein